MREKNCFKSEGGYRSYDAVCNCLLNINGIELEIFYRNQICRNEVFFFFFFLDPGMPYLIAIRGEFCSVKHLLWKD